jgi:hypothetical protein
LSPRKVLYPEEYSSSFSTLNALSMPTICFRQNETFVLTMENDNAQTKTISLKRKDNEEISIPWKRVRVNYEVYKIV